MKVWAVMCGEYSDKYLAAIFGDADMAAAYARAHDGWAEEHEVKTELDEDASRQLRPGEHTYWVRMDAAGNRATASETFAPWEKVKTRYLSYSHQGDGLWFVAQCIIAKDEKHAIKILNERRSQWLALGQPEGVRRDYGWYEYSPQPS